MGYSVLEIAGGGGNGAVLVVWAAQPELELHVAGHHGEELDLVVIPPPTPWTHQDLWVTELAQEVWLGDVPIVAVEDMGRRSYKSGFGGGRGGGERSDRGGFGKP